MENEIASLRNHTFLTRRNFGFLAKSPERSFDICANSPSVRENKVKRHVLFLAPLAFVSPRMVSATIEGSPQRDLTVTNLANRLHFLWKQQQD
jgi:hypothetical protein